MTSPSPVPSPGRRMMMTGPPSAMEVPTSSSSSSWWRGVARDVLGSTEIVFRSKLSVFLIAGPIAVIGDYTGALGEPLCFTLSGIALIPCAERLSFLTEQVAEHTNGTIGALLNATFGNAPELLIATAALRSGFYRVVQLAMLGSMLTNMLFVFGVACLVGGLRWQVQELRLTSGNVNVGMLLLSTSGVLFPAALILSGQLPYENKDENVPTQTEVTFCRVNAVVMMVLYICYLVFQLGTHKQEFEDEAHAERRAQRSMFCMSQPQQAPSNGLGQWRLMDRELVPMESPGSDDDVRINDQDSPSTAEADRIKEHKFDHRMDEENGALLCPRSPQIVMSSSSHSSVSRRKQGTPVLEPSSPGLLTPTLALPKSKISDYEEESDDLSDEMHDGIVYDHSDAAHGPVLPLHAGVVWLFIITLCISSLSGILVDTIDGFADRMGFSQVFTSMVVVPFFSNVAEQVSAFLFAFRNEMDLCVGVTIGSAIQIATFVLPGSVLIGMVMDRSMTLYFHGYETVCIMFGTIVVGAVLQGGTTNWLIGAIMVGIYIIMATGIWFHEVENLSIDGEVAIRNETLGP